MKALAISTRQCYHEYIVLLLISSRRILIVSSFYAPLAFFVFFAVLLVTALLFICAGRERALALAFMASQRNLGLMLAATGGALPELTWLYFALSQFPIYLSPHILRPLARRVLKKEPNA